MRPCLTCSFTHRDPSVRLPRLECQQTQTGLSPFGMGPETYSRPCESMIAWSLDLPGGGGGGDDTGTVKVVVAGAEALPAASVSDRRTV